MKRHFIIFDATGDLTFRYLIPALSEFCEANKLPEGFSIIGVALTDIDLYFLSEIALFPC